MVPIVFWTWENADNVLTQFKWDKVNVGQDPMPALKYHRKILEASMDKAADLKTIVEEENHNNLSTNQKKQITWLLEKHKNLLKCKGGAWKGKYSMLHLKLEENTFLENRSKFLFWKESNSIRNWTGNKMKVQSFYCCQKMLKNVNGFYQCSACQRKTRRAL